MGAWWQDLYECAVDRMRQAVILGSSDTKRTIYLEKAAAQEGVSVTLVDWQDWETYHDLPDAEELLVKIDPPRWTSCSLAKLNQLADGYMHELEQLSRLARCRAVTFLNEPSVIAGLLDKRACKERLQQAGLPVTETIRLSDCSNDGKLTVEMLLEEMRRQRVHQVFIKPVMGSGAAGVSALRWNARTGQMALYTCALLDADAGLINTKCLRRFSKAKDILPLLRQILALDCIIERWYPKAVHQGCSYDLRAVVQEGKVDFLLARLSKGGPITNLHLNNHPLEITALGLSEQLLEDIAILCRDCVKAYPGLRSAGIDILLEKGHMRPRIIEMNAQGDLIYQDIYHENVIYSHQARMIKNWLQMEA